jgi:histidyl-tRNA synthetase
MTMEVSNGKRIYEPSCDIYIGALGAPAKVAVVPMVMKLRASGIYAEMDVLDRSAKAQMKYANKIGSKFSCIIGENELENKEVTIKDMDKHEQEVVQFEKILAYMLDKKSEESL